MALSQSNIAARRRGVSIIALLVLLSLGAAVVGGAFYYQQSDSDQARQAALILRPVERGPFDHIVLEQGEIESSSNTEIVCQVKSRGGSTSGTTILWVIEEGTSVEKGEKLVELDSSQLETELKQQKIIVSNAHASLSSAEATVEQAKIAREEYLEGVYLTEQKAIESEIAVAQQELRKAQLDVRSIERMVAKGLVNELQLKGAEYGVTNAQSQLEAAEGRLRVLENLTRQKMLVQYNSDIDAAEAAKEAARSTLLEEQEKLTDIEQQIKACVMYAPAPGVVVHGNRYSSRGGNAEFVVEPGATVRERQTIIQLPDPTKMQVAAKINESRITLVREGMPARIRVDAAAGLELHGRVKKVNRYAEPSSWFSSSIKEYACMVEIIDPPDAIRTGMTAEVRIFVEQQSDALQIPIQAVYEHFGDTYTLVRTPQGRFETRQVEINATNDTMATIDSGVEEGESVVLNLRSHLDMMDLPEEDKSKRDGMATQLASHGEEAVGEDLDGPSDGPRGADRARGGGGMPSAAEIVESRFQQYDSDSDGSLSEDEIDSMDERAKRSAENADADGDGKVSRAELTTEAAKVVARMRQQGGGGPPGGGHASNGPPGGGGGDGGARRGQ